MLYEVITLSRLLFLCLNKLTGITPEWGLITGVRPVKRVNKMIKTGLPDDSIKKQLEKKYLVAKDKINLAIITANTQKEILGTLKDGVITSYSIHYTKLYETIQQKPESNSFYILLNK